MAIEYTWSIISMECLPTYGEEPDDRMQARHLAQKVRFLLRPDRPSWPWSLMVAIGTTRVKSRFASSIVARACGLTLVQWSNLRRFTPAPATKE